MNNKSSNIKESQQIPSKTRPPATRLAGRLPSRTVHCARGSIPTTRGTRHVRYTERVGCQGVFGRFPPPGLTRDPTARALRRSSSRGGQPRGAASPYRARTLLPPRSGSPRAPPLPGGSSAPGRNGPQGPAAGPAAHPHPKAPAVLEGARALVSSQKSNSGTSARGKGKRRSQGGKR